MKTITSVSGGKSSAYIAANYESDHLLFALVRIDDPDCRFPDKKTRKIVEDRIQKPFVGTAEDDLIIYTMLDLEQFLGRQIHWVSGITYDEVVDKKGGRLPDKLHRFCTSHLKIEPMFYWWAENIGSPVYMNIGYRANEGRRAKKMISRMNTDGLIPFKASFGKHKSGRHKGRNKWEEIPWQSPKFPLIDSGIYKDDIVNYWRQKPVRFAPLNNCIGCFHRNPILLNKMSAYAPNKFEWFCKQEEKGKGTWRDDVSYKQIKNHRMQLELNFDDFSACDSGFCEI